MPIVTQLGMDPVQYCMPMIVNLGMGLIASPVGGALFIGSAISGVGVEKLRIRPKITASPGFARLYPHKRFSGGHGAFILWQTLTCAMIPFYLMMITALLLVTFIPQL